MKPEQIQGIYKALNIATAIHSGQVDKSKEPYIFHPIRVMLKGRTYEEMVVGILHDVLEDGDDDISRVEIKALFGDVIANAVHAITRLPDEEYRNYIVRCRENALARMVKKHDLDDNLDAERMNTLEPGIRKRLYKKYAEAVWLLHQDV